MGIKLEKIDEFRFRIPRETEKRMRVDGIIYMRENFKRKGLLDEKCLQQVVNVACLPGIEKASFAMPDMHWGYGFPIGGVAATNIAKSGVISPGGVGFDINCGVRLVKTRLLEKDLPKNRENLIDNLYHAVPAGVGVSGSVRTNKKELKKLLVKGAAWAVENGFGERDDLEYTEEGGAISGADPEAVSEYAFERGEKQPGTLGAGNHFIEVQIVDQVFDSAAAECFDVESGQVVLMIHTGSRGFGHQVCTDYVKKMLSAMRKYSIEVPDRQLACAPVNSPEGKQYLSAMACAANYAWCNRQIIMHHARIAFEKTFKQSWRSLGLELLYDVAHNIAKTEEHFIDGKRVQLCVHRKGATRAFGPARAEVPERYRAIGQPVIIPGDMGRHSYLLAGTQQAMEESFGSTCHGAGRVKSRTEALRTLDKRKILDDLDKKGIIIRAVGSKTICEEAPQAYKDVNDVVEVVHKAGISRKVCRMRPAGVIKG